MKIGIDLRSLEGDTGHRGIGRYVSSLIEALSHIDRENEYYFLLTGKNTPEPKLSVDKGFRFRFIQGPGPGLRTVKYFRIFKLLPRPLKIDKYGLDVFLQPDPWHRASARKTPLVCTLHDLIPFKFSETYQHVHFGGFGPKSLIGYVRMKLQWKATEWDFRAYKNRDQILSISKHSKDDLLAWIPGVVPERIAVVPLAADKLPAPRATTHLRKLNLQDFLFYVGGSDPRKGLIGFVKSLEDIWQTSPDIQFVIAGKEFNNPKVGEAVKLHKAVANLSRPKQVIFTDYISDPELSYLYANAAAFVFPSRYEGFGLPILEAMQAGCPVVCYDNSSLPEVAGNAAQVVKDGESMVGAVRKILADKNVQKDLATKGRKQASKFSWQRTARETLAVLQAAAGEDV